MMLHQETTSQYDNLQPVQVEKFTKERDNQHQSNTEFVLSWLIVIMDY